MGKDRTTEYDVSSPASRTLLTVLGTVVAVAVLAGIVVGVSVLLRDTKTAASTIEIGDSNQMVIRADGADIRLVPGERDDVIAVRAQITSGIRSTDYALERDGDQIYVRSSCQAWLSPGCGVSVTLEVPRDLPLIVETGSGDVVADSVSGTVLTVETTSGDIVARSVGLEELSATTTSGAIRATFGSPPRGVKALTGSGDITVSVPVGERTYAIDATSASGDVELAIGSDENGEGFIHAVSESGDIRLS